MTERKASATAKAKAKAEAKMQGSLHCAFAKSANAPVEMTHFCFVALVKLHTSAETASGLGVGDGAGSPEGAGYGVDYAV